MTQTQRTKLLLLIPHLGGGGAEQVTAQLARNLDPRRFEIHLGLIARDSPGARPPPEWVQVHRLQRERVRQAWLPLIRLIRAERPHVLLSGMAHLNFLVLLLTPWLPRHTRILVRQNTTASAAARSWLARLPYRYLYPRADAILCQSDAMASDLAEHFAIAPEKLKVLANPIDVSAIRAASVTARQTMWPPNAWPRLLSVGRLAPEKGVDLLLHALNEVRRRYPQIYLILLGAGPEEAALKRLSVQLQLEDAVSFAGRQQNLADYYAGATLFVLPSRYEGMPNALLEAAAAGLPLALTPCSTGVCDLLRNAPGTWLASCASWESLADTILQALATLHNAPDSPRRFQHPFLARFETSAAIAAYEALLEGFQAQADA